MRTLRRSARSNWTFAKNILQMSSHLCQFHQVGLKRLGEKTSGKSLHGEEEELRPRNSNSSTLRFMPASRISPPNSSIPDSQSSITRSHIYASSSAIDRPSPVQATCLLAHDCGWLWSAPNVPDAAQLCSRYFPAQAGLSDAN